MIYTTILNTDTLMYNMNATLYTEAELFILYQMLDDDFWRYDNAAKESSLIKRDKTRILTKVSFDLFFLYLKYDYKTNES